MGLMIFFFFFQKIPKGNHLGTCIGNIEFFEKILKTFSKKIRKSFRKKSENISSPRTFSKKSENISNLN